MKPGTLFVERPVASSIFFGSVNHFFLIACQAGESSMLYFRMLVSAFLQFGLV